MKMVDGDGNPMKGEQYMWDGDYLTEINWNEMELTGTLELDCFDHLEKVWCGYNQLTELDVTKCASLVELNCGENQLSELDVSKCPSLECLDCYGNQLSELNLTNNKKLDALRCDDTVTVIGYTKSE